MNNYQEDFLLLSTATCYTEHLEDRLDREDIVSLTAISLWHSPMQLADCRDFQDNPLSRTFGLI